jgi:hypothetical protein
LKQECGFAGKKSEKNIFAAKLSTLALATQASE